LVVLSERPPLISVPPEQAHTPSSMAAESAAQNDLLNIDFFMRRLLLSLFDKKI
jgi:hypothetical protein